MPDSPAHALDLDILSQPDDASCGPTCLEALYRHYGDPVPLETLIAEVPKLAGGGTLAVNLAAHALRRGYRALVYTYNLTVFDPTWFEPGVDLPAKLREQAGVKPDPKLTAATDAYLEYLRLGGELVMEPLTPGLLRGSLQRGRPLLTGLSATFLYRSKREVGDEKLVEDDVRGVPTGHFVVLSGWNTTDRSVRVADPLRDNPRYPDRIYWVPVQRVINSILLGVLTYDANLLVLEPPDRPA